MTATDQTAKPAQHYNPEPGAAKAPGEGSIGNPPPTDLLMFESLTSVLMMRLHLGETAAAATLLTGLAAAMGASVRVRNPFGHELPLQYEFAHCAKIPSTDAGEALGLSLAAIRSWGQTLTKWNQTVGAAKLQAIYAELHADVAALEREAGKPSPTIPPPGPGLFESERARMKNLQEETRQRLLETLALKKRELSQMRVNLRPVLVCENPSWEAILGPDQVAFDGALTVTSCDGRALESLAALRGEKRRALRDLFEAARIGQPALRASGGFSTVAFNTSFVVGMPALKQALGNRSFIESGLLDAVMFLDASKKPVVADDTPAVENGAAMAWLHLMNRFFDFRVSGGSACFEMDRQARALFQEFRDWSERFSGQRILRFARRWPDCLLKIGLAFEVLLSGTSGGKVTVQALEKGVQLMKSMCQEHAALVGRFASAAAPKGRDVDQMVARVASAGSMSRRELFRRYNDQAYSRLQPILDQAIAEGRLVLNGKTVSLCARAAEREELPESVSAGAATASVAEILEPL